MSNDDEYRAIPGDPYLVFGIDPEIRPKTKLELLRAWLDANFSSHGEREQNVFTVRAKVAYEILDGDAP